MMIHAQHMHQLNLCTNSANESPFRLANIVRSLKAEQAMLNTSWRAAAPQRQSHFTPQVFPTPTQPSHYTWATSQDSTM
jgi:hypothetical protein